MAVGRLDVTLLGRRVLGDVDLAVPSGSWVTLVGPNGAGKSTLLKAVAGAVEHAGSIGLDEVSLDGMRSRERARQVAFVPQEPTRPDGMNVVDYVLLGRTPYVPYFAVESASDVAVVEELLDTLELRELADRPVTSLSGGEFQRAVLARALAQQAPLLLLDEPTSSLDLGHAQQVLELVDELRVDRGLTVVSALHDLTTAGQFADRLVLLVDGEVVAEGPVREVLTEKLISAHYGAAVRVVHDADGGVVVVPVRERTARLTKRTDGA
ncbi:ABC transporter ATP-binding protein [Haloactinopolyspora alba]|uniref:ABC transporter ATP-binding protein n=1 Tax=Haloactinopolyspora alba TaxID=648780 RepID=UPI000D0CCBDA